MFKVSEISRSLIPYSPSAMKAAMGVGSVDGCE